MDPYIQGLVNSVVSASIYGTQDFTDDLPTKFVESKYEDPVSELKRYAFIIRSQHLRKARDDYRQHKDKDRLAKEFVAAYDVHSLIRKEFK